MTLTRNLGDVLFREGEPANRFFIIDSGLISLRIGIPDRGMVQLQTIRAGEVLGWSWLFPPYCWHFDAITLQATEALAFDGACLRGKCDANHELGYQLMNRFASIITDRLQATRLQLLDLYGVPGPRPERTPFTSPQQSAGGS